MLTSDRILINAGPRCKKAQEQFRPTWAPCYMSQGVQLHVCAIKRANAQAAGGGPAFRFSILNASGLALSSVSCEGSDAAGNFTGATQHRCR